MPEQIYYKYDHLKVTNISITYHHITMPIDKIDDVRVDFKNWRMTAALTIFILFLILVPSVCHFYGCCGWFGLLFVRASLIRLRIN